MQQSPHSTRVSNALEYRHVLLGHCVALELSNAPTSGLFALIGTKTHARTRRNDSLTHALTHA